MKKTIFYILTAVIINFISFTKLISQTLEGHITISGAYALYPMTVKWAKEFKKLHPYVKIDISTGGAGKGMTDVLNNSVDIAMVSRDVTQDEMKIGAYQIAVAKDAVIPVVSAANPLWTAILAKGISKDTAKNIWISGKYKTWTQAFGIVGDSAMHVYTRSDDCGAAEVWANYLGKNQKDLQGIGISGDQGLAFAVLKDPLGIGYNNIGYVYDYKTRKQDIGLKVIPIDLNNNGKIDPDENFYDSLDDLLNAIITEKYPSPPARILFFVTKNHPQKKVVIEFIKWILTDGQKYVNETGYIKLSDITINLVLKDLKK